MSHDLTALYERLSYDDELQGESNSISNQKAMLEDYAEKNGFTGIRHFTDDGISGTTFEREGLQAMLAEVEKGNIGTIIVKDMSRLGRNYVQMGMLREQLQRFAEEIQSHIEDRQTVDFTEQKKRMTVCEKRIGELEMLIAKIYEDNALGKLSDKRYTVLYNQYEGEQEQLQSELDGYKTEQAQYENDRKSAARFLKLVERYSNAEEMSTVMLNEFVEKIIVHERDRKGSADTTQKIEIYFNFIGAYIPPTMAEKEPTPEELEEMRKKEARKDRLHQNYLKRKANGKQKEYEERTKGRKKAQIESQKEQIRAEDREKGIYFHAGVPNIPRASRRQYKMFYSEKAMTVTIIVFFHALITTENETIFFRASVHVIM